MKLSRFSFILILTVSLVAIMSAGQTMQTGSIKGTITDTEGNSFPGVSITVTGSKLIGSMTDISRSNGAFRTLALPPGTYTVMAELDGFKTMKKEGIVVRIGMVVKVDFAMEPATLEEEITVIAVAPTVDVQSSKLSNVITSSDIARLPIDRNFNNIMNLAPGTVSTGPRHVIHGGTAISTAFDVDGINVNDPSNNHRFFTVQYDAMEEVEIVTGALPAQVGNTGGTFVNVVTKSGGNDFHGTFQTYYTKSSLSQILFPDTQLKAMGMGKPVSPKLDIDVSATLGGPIKKDKLWFFSSLNFAKNEQFSSFIPTTILGRSFDQYPVESQTIQGLFKLSAQLSKSMRFFTMINYQRSKTPFGGTGARITQEATNQRPKTSKFIATANLNIVLSPNSFLDFRGSYNKLDNPIYFQDEADDLGHFWDVYTGYQWGSDNRPEEHTYRNIKGTSVRMTQFLDNFLGGNHEIIMGLEYEDGYQQWNYWRANPIRWDYYNGNPYYYRGLYGLDAPHPTFGDGRLTLLISSGAEDGSEPYTAGHSRTFAGFIQDSWTIKEKLTLNLGVRYDRLTGSMPAVTKRAAAGLPEEIGAYAVEPVLGINPFGELSAEAFPNILVWNSLSPRIGLTYDLFGNAKTALKAGYSSYAMAMPTMYYLGMHPLRVRNVTIDWWDLNGNGVLDSPGVDDYAARRQPVEMLPDFYNNRHLDGIKVPHFNQWTLGVDHALNRDLKIGLQFIYSNKKNPVDTVLYDRDTQKIWNTYERAPEWWVPFTTIVPAVGEFPDQEVTMYFLSADAPWATQFTAMTNVEEAERRYRALEFVFNKRYANGWSLGGSVVWSKTEGNNQETYGPVWGWAASYDNANFFVNGFGRTPFDIPLSIKLYGSFELPFDFNISFFLTHASGQTWQRTVQVFPPSDWAAANNTRPDSYTINVEQRGSQRYQSRTNVDFRLEKEFQVGQFGRFGLFLDVFNLFGARYVNHEENPGGRWSPDAENTNQGTYLTGGNYTKLTGIDGVRIFKFSVRFTF